MQGSLGESNAWRFVYGTLDPAAAPALEARALLVARRWFGADSTRVIADRALGEPEAAGVSLFLIGSPRENAWTARLAAALPVRFTASGFHWRDRDYERADDVLQLVYPNPLAPRRFLVLFAANSAVASRGMRGMFLGEEDWRIVRGGELARSGQFAQDAAHPWRYDPALDRDREAERECFASTLRSRGSAAIVVRAPPGLATADATFAAAQTLLARMSAQGLPAPRRAAPLSLTLYGSLEQKGLLTRDTRPEHLDAGAAHAALAAGREALDLWSVAAARLVQLGASGNSRFLEPAGAWWADRLEGEPLERAVSRLYFGGVLPTAAIAATRAGEWRSPLVWIPARALLARAVCESAPPAARARVLLALVQRDPPGELDSLCRAVGVPAARAAKRYQALADSLARLGQRGLAAAQPTPWRPRDGFQRGICLSHSVDLEGGYLSAHCAAELAALQHAGADWVSLTPFAYVPDAHVPELFPSADGGPDEETDEAVCEAAAHARALGMRVWLKPHLWSRVWIGQLDFTPHDWPRFFARYREYMLHEALLAERERMDGLFIGHELVSATQHDQAPWRELIGDVRRVYTGTLSYSANWDEVQHVPFWDALDVIGVSFYHPLATQPTHDAHTLEDGAAKALAELKVLAERTGRPVLLSEVGYPPLASAPVQPWEEHGSTLDPEAQRACYRALVDALDPCDWVAGACWWKWPSGDEPGGDTRPSYSPKGRPAEAVLRDALQRWRGRPVRVLATK